MSSHRKPPLPELFTSYRHSEHKGLCKWCREPLPVKGEDGYHHAREWHPDCKVKFFTLTMPAMARYNVFERDDGICADCGDDLKLFVPKYKRWAWQLHERSISWALCDEVGKSWQLDHIQPLWKSKNLTDEERIKFFEIDNLQTLCVPCHAKKTKLEAAERAEIRVLDDR